MFIYHRTLPLEMSLEASSSTFRSFFNVLIKSISPGTVINPPAAPTTLNPIIINIMPCGKNETGAKNNTEIPFKNNPII